MRQCDNCGWVGEWEDYSDSGYNGYLCEVCAWTKLPSVTDMVTIDLAKGIAVITNVICSALNIDFNDAVRANMALLKEEEN